jgi:uncharacterized RDD family membrane protein YckC
MTAGLPPPAAVAPSIRRRLACMLYESVLLFGVVMTAGYLYSSLTQQRHALQGSTGLQFFLFVVLGIYFAGFWSRSGQTLAMKTWHIRLQTAHGGVPSQWRAFSRYVASWLWFLPALACAHLSGIRSTLAFAVIVAAGMLAYALLARLRADRQFLHDVLCGTQLVDARPAQPAPAQSVP